MVAPTDPARSLPVFNEADIDGLEEEKLPDTMSLRALGVVPGVPVGVEVALFE